MSARTRWILGIAALAVTVVLVAFVRSALAPSSTDPIDGRVVAQSAPPQPRSSAPLVGGEHDTAQARVAEVVPDEAVKAQDVGTPLDPDAATIVVEVVRARDGVPVAGALVWVNGNTALGWNATTDVDGVAAVEVSPELDPRAVEVNLPHDRLHSSSERFERVRRSLDPLAPGERRVVRIELPDARVLAFWGLVVDRTSGAPIAGARIVGAVRVATEETPLVSDGSGLFRASLLAGAGVPLRVVADGHGLALVVAKAGYEEPGRALRIELERSAVLHALARGEPSEVSAFTRVVLRAKVHDLQRDDPSAGMALLRLGGSYHEDWSAELDPSGACTFEDLPAGVPLVPHLAGATFEDWRPLGDELVLAPGETRRVEWNLAGVVRGRVVDQHGRPVGGAVLWCIAEARGQGALALRSFTESEKDQVGATATADEHGAFELTGVPDGAWWIGVRPRDAYDDLDPERDVSSDAVLVQVGDAGVTECEVRAWRGITIEGSVRTPVGAPGARAFVFAIGLEPSTPAFVAASTDAEGAFVLGPLAPGRYSLEATGGAPGLVSSEPVEAEAGATDVVLELRVGGRVLGRVVNPPDGASKLAFTLVPTREESSQGLRTGDLKLERDGTFALADLEPGSYHLTVWGPGPTVAVVRDVAVAAGGDTAELAVVLQPGGALRVRYEGIERFAQLALWSGDVQIAADGIQSGTEVAKSVPAGEVRVVLRDQARRSVERRVRVAAGAVEAVVLTPE